MESLAEIINNHSTRLFLLPNDHMHSGNKKRRSFLSLLFAAGDVRRCALQERKALTQIGESHLTAPG